MGLPDQQQLSQLSEEAGRGRVGRGDASSLVVPLARVLRRRLETMDQVKVKALFEQMDSRQGLASAALWDVLSAQCRSQQITLC